MLSSPIMLVGAERSGTTLLRLMLDHHPLITLLPEFELVIQLMTDDGKWPELDEFYEHLETHRGFGDSDLAVDSNLDYPTLVDSFLRQRLSRSLNGVIGATVHYHFDRLLYLWPDARFIHLMRDARDVADSVVRMGWAGNHWTALDRWIEAERLWESMKQRLSADRRISVRYEDLVANPIAALTRVCEFIGVRFHKSMLEYTRTTTYDKPDPSLAFSWRRDQGEYSVRLAEARVGEMLTDRNYGLSGLRPLSISTRMVRRLRRQDRWARRGHRLRRYGYRLFLAELMARRLRLVNCLKRLKLRINDIYRSLLR